MDGNKIYPSRNASTKRPLDDDDNPFQETMALLEMIGDMRIIEKITRPATQQQRQKKLEQFDKAFSELERRLIKIECELGQKHNEIKESNPKGKSLSVASITNQVYDWKKAIRSLQTKYYEVDNRMTQIFIDGSFKHYGRICELLHLHHTFEVMDIEAWASQCLKSRKKDGPNCCQ